MHYKFETTLKEYSDLSSGRVLYSSPGVPAFPVRLASEIFQRCLASRNAIYGMSTPCTLYDPCCGGAYHLSVLGYLHREHIREILASDIDPKAVDLAVRNLGLLGLAGLDRRIAEIRTMIEQYNKESHREALKSAYRLRGNLTSSNQVHSLPTRVFQASATDQETMLQNVRPGSVDLVFSDIPYGQHSRWQGSGDPTNPIGSMLESLFDLLSSSSIVAIVSDKGQKAMHPRYQRIEQFQIGKRRVAIFRPISG